MRGRIVLFVVLAVVLALAGVYVGWSTNTATAVGEPAPATSSDLSAGSNQVAGSGQPRVSVATVPKSSAPKASPPKATAGHATQPSQTSSTPPTSPPRRAGPVRFGQVTTAGRPSETGISDDRRALSTTFSDFEVTMDSTSTEPVVTKTFSMTLPLTDGAKGETLGVNAAGYAILVDGAKARMTIRGGGQQIIKGFATGSNDEYVETLALPARPGITYQLSFAIEIKRGAGAEGNGFLNMTAIEIEIS